MNLIEAQELSIGYNGKTVADSLSVQLRAGELVALLGKNGIGKSTLIRTLCGELPPLKGSVNIRGVSLDRIPRKRLARELAIVTTESLQAGALKVREIVGLGRQPYTGMFGRLNGDDEEFVIQSMENTGIAYKADAYFAELSDGEKQKTMLARALAQDTDIIILDEPFSFLDVASRVEILALLRQLAHDRGKGILFSSHDVSQSLRMSDRVMLFTHDRELISGTPADLIGSEAVSRLFDVRNVVFSKDQYDFVIKEK